MESILNNPNVASIDQDKYGRYVIFVNKYDYDVLHDHFKYPLTINGKNVLVHFASSRACNKLDYEFKDLVNEPFSKESEPDPEVLSFEIKNLRNKYGHFVVNDIFYEIHDGPNAVTSYSQKYESLAKDLKSLYDYFGFDLMYELLEK